MLSRLSTPIARQAAPVVVARRNFSNRPVSPHVGIYDWSKVPTAITSIVHRATGVTMSVGVAGMSVMAFTHGCDLTPVVASFKQDHGFLTAVLQGGVAFNLSWHTYCGLRHIYWDQTAAGVDNEFSDNTSKAIIGASVATTVAAVIYGAAN